MLNYKTIKQLIPILLQRLNHQQIALLPLKSTFDLNSWFFNADVTYLTKTCVGMANRKFFVLTEEVLLKSFQGVVCEYKAKFIKQLKSILPVNVYKDAPQEPVDTDIYFLVNVDPGAEEIQKTVVYSSKFFNTKTGRLSRLLSRYAYEFGLPIWGMREVSKFNAASLETSNFHFAKEEKVDIAIKLLCQSETVVRSDGETKDLPKIGNLMTLLYCCFGLVGTCLLVLLLERFKARMRP